MSYQVRFDPTSIRFVQPDVAVGSDPHDRRRHLFRARFLRPLTSKRARRANGCASVVNLGQRPERPAVRAGRRNKFIHVRYTGAARNVTGAPLQGSYRSPMLVAGASPDFVRATFIPNRWKSQKRSGARKRMLKRNLTTLVYANSIFNPARYDGGWLRVRTR